MSTSEEKSFWFNVTSDYRSGVNVYAYTKPPKEYDYEADERTPDEANEITFILPHKGYRLYVVNECPDYESVWHMDIDDDTDYEKIYLKIFSQIHGCLPFKVTGLSVSGKDEGDYPDIPTEIEEMTNVIDKTLVDKIEKNGGYYFVFIVDSDGNELLTEMLFPIF